MAKISIIIPIYNVEKYLRQCLDSVLNQTFGDIEIICVNDGSTDSCPQILEEYSQRDDRIKVITKENGGLSSARNAGIEISTSEFLGFVDSDDWIDKTTFEKAYNSIVKENSDICFYQLVEFYDNENRFGKNDYFILRNYRQSMKGTYTYKDLKGLIFNVFCAFTKLYRKDFFIKNNLFYEEGVLFEDVVPHVKGILLANKISFVDEALYYYRLRDNSIMSNVAKSPRILDSLHYIEQVEKFLKENEYYEELKIEFLNFAGNQMNYLFGIANNRIKIIYIRGISSFLNKHIDIKNHIINTNLFWILRNEIFKFVLHYKKDGSNNFK